MSNNLSKTKQYAILWLNSQNISINDISKELKINSNDITSTIDQYVPKVNDSSNMSQPITSHNLMITHTAGKKNNTVAIMTKEASELNDHNNKNQSQPATNKNINRDIFRPKNS
jgi:hypothetical protein